MGSWNALDLTFCGKCICLSHVENPLLSTGLADLPSVTMVTVREMTMEMETTAGPGNWKLGRYLTPHEISRAGSTLKRRPAQSHHLTAFQHLAEQRQKRLTPYQVHWVVIISSGGPGARRLQRVCLPSEDCAVPKPAAHWCSCPHNTLLDISLKNRERVFCCCKHWSALLAYIPPSN